MSADPGTRFAHLLQPIKDLSKVWKIEIADELEKYVEEVVQLIVTNPEDGYSQLNFAEAALLIQGSTAIYSRKVELLHQLVYQALDLIAAKKDGKDGRRPGKAAQSGLTASIPETEELLTIDHLIKEGRNITIDANALAEGCQEIQRRVPLFLMPRDLGDRRKTEFRISNCCVHRSGMYLLQESDAKLLDGVDQSSADDDLAPLEGLTSSAGEPLVPAPPREVQDLDDRLQELLRDQPEAGFEATATPAVGSRAPVGGRGVAPGGGGAPGRPEVPAPVESAAMAAVRENLPALLAGPDPWAHLDENEVFGKDVPLEAGPTSKRIANKRLLIGGNGFDESSETIAELAAKSDEGMWGLRIGGADACEIDPAKLIDHPVESLFLKVAGKLRSSGLQTETRRCGFSPIWLEFEDLFLAAASKRRSAKLQQRLQPSKLAVAAFALNADGAADTADPADGSGSEDEDVVAFGSPRRRSVDRPLGADSPLPVAQAVPSQPLVGTSSEPTSQDEQRRLEVAELENMIQEAQLKYESTIRAHLKNLNKDSVGDGQQSFPQLYANVRRWQEQLEPVLKECESHPEFDIHRYSTKMLSKICDMEKKPAKRKQDQEVISFDRLARGQPRWEVCRRFLTCLLLTNAGNTDIVYEDDSARINGFGVQLLEREKLLMSFEDAEHALFGAHATSKAKKAPAPLLSAEGLEDAEGAAAAPARKKRRQATS
eukprot:TRINITY_DN90331_c0_g1_i1.p1 TRINITY_DN90331_c0_g1~~TRINITY_DN90331_c0_g1_i1.p1  ORF type:complete len:714 (+),score=182.42 TRINITY_DN90331_c0_g1_i1:134-2275(+)